MASRITKEIVTAHFEALFSGDDRVTVRPLRNFSEIEPPRKESEIDGKAVIWLQFPATKEEARGIGAADIPWDEAGAFMFHVAVASLSRAAEALADELAETAKASLRNACLEDRMDIEGLYGSELARRWRGNFYGESVSVAFETQDIG